MHAGRICTEFGDGQPRDVGLINFGCCDGAATVMEEDSMRTERTDDAGPIYATAAGMPARYRLPEPEPLPPHASLELQPLPHFQGDMQETTQGIGGYEEEAEENASKGHEEENEEKQDEKVEEQEEAEESEDQEDETSDET